MNPHCAYYESREAMEGDLRDGVTALFHGAEPPKGGPEQERGVRCGTPNNPSLGRTHAFDGWPGMATRGLSGTWIEERDAAGKTFCAFAILHRAESRWFAIRGKPRSSHATSPCFSRRGDHPPSLRSTRNKHNGYEAAVTGVIRNSTIAGAGPL